jgi:hypothetical protein
VNKCIGNHPSKQKHNKAIISKQSKQQRIEGENNTDRQRTGRKSNEEERGLEGGWLQI